MRTQETFQTNIESQLEQWNAQLEAHSQKIEELRAKAEKLENEAKVQYLAQIKELENKLEVVKSKIADGQKRLDKLKLAGQEAWEDVKVGGQSAWDEMMGGINKAWGEVKTSFDSASSKLQNRTNKKK